MFKKSEQIGTPLICIVAIIYTDFLTLKNLPVRMAPGWLCKYRGIPKPDVSENPMTSKLRVLFRSTNWRLERPIAITIAAQKWNTYFFTILKVNIIILIEHFQPMRVANSDYFIRSDSWTFPVDVGGKQWLYAIFNTESDATLSDAKSLFGARIGWKWSIKYMVVHISFRK